MIPLRDDVPSRTIPFVNYGLMALNVLFFLGELGLGANIERFLFQSAVVPVLYSGGDGVVGVVDVVRTSLDPDFATRTLVSMFLHGGWAHLLGNMLYLWIFGDNVEDRMGHGRYLVFYLLCGWIASYAHVVANPTSRMPSIGASGAIAGVLAAYAVLYPHARVVVALPPPFLFFFPLFALPALAVLGLWFLQQFLLGTLALVQTEAGGTAWWAHIGGFVAGLVLVGIFQRPTRRPRDHDLWWEDRPVRRGFSRF